MTLSTVYLGPGLGVEANCVTLQTCGKTLMVTLKDIMLSAQLTLHARLQVVPARQGERLFPSLF